MVSFLDSLFWLRNCGAFVSVHRSCAPRLELPSPFPSPFFSTTTKHSGYGAYGQQKESKRTGKEKQWMSSSFFIRLDEALSSSSCHVTSQAVMMWLTRCPWINVFLFLQWLLFHRSPSAKALNGYFSLLPHVS